MVYYPLVLVELVLNFFADADPRLSDYPPVEVIFSLYNFIDCIFIFYVLNQFLETMS